MKFSLLRIPLAAACIAVTCQALATSPSRLDHSRLSMDHRPSTTDYRPSSIDHRPLSIDHRPSSIAHRPSTIDSIDVTFQILAPMLPPDSTVHVAGSPQEWGYWAPDGLPLMYVGNGMWTGIARMKHPQTFEYKFTLGRWENEAVDEEGYPWANQTATTAEGLVVRDTVWSWLEGGAPPKRIQGQVTGVVEHVPGWEWAGLKARDVWVWLPPGYADEPEMFCDVLVMHDGRNVFDPATSNFGVDWGVDEVMDSLIRGGDVRPTIVVAADCTDARGSEYAPGPAGEAYMDWVVEALLPWVRQRYRVHEGPLHTTVAGASMGGLISFMLAERHPEAFGAAICMSPAFRYKDFDYPAEVAGRPWPANAGFFYIDNGGVGLEEVLQPGVDAMLAVLADKGLTAEDQTFHLHPTAKHFEADWGARIGDAVQETAAALARRLAASH